MQRNFRIVLVALTTAVVFQRQDNSRSRVHVLFALAMTEKNIRLNPIRKEKIAVMATWSHTTTS